MKTRRFIIKISLCIIGIVLCIAGIAALKPHMNPNYYRLTIDLEDNQTGYSQSTTMLIELNRFYEIKGVPWLVGATVKVILYSDDIDNHFLILLGSLGPFYMDSDYSSGENIDSGRLEGKRLTLKIDDEIPKTFIAYFAFASLFLLFYFDFDQFAELGARIMSDEWQYVKKSNKSE